MIANKKSKEKLIIKNNLYNLINTYYLDAFFIIGITLLHLYMNINTGDFGYFSVQLDTKSIINFLIERYETWSSRLFIEALLVMITRTPILWYLIDIVATYFIFYFLYNLFPKESRDTAKWCLFFCLGCYPYIDMSSAGWVATTMNYVWPLACGLCTIYYVLKNVHDNMNDSLSPLKWLVVALCATYASSCEQMAMFLAVTLLVIVVHSASNNKLNKLTVMVCAIVIINVLIIVICPGNRVRSIEESNNWWPDYIHLPSGKEYGSMGLPMRFFVAFSSTIDRYLFGDCLIMLIFVSLMSTLILAGKPYSRILKLTSLFPPLCILAFSVVQHISEIAPGSPLALFQMPNYDFSKRRLIIFIIEVIILLITTIEFSSILKNEDPQSNSILTILFVMALATRLAAAMGPTVFASGYRTSIFFEFYLIFITVIMLIFIKNKNVKVFNFFFLLLVCVASSSFYSLIQNMIKIM